MFVLIFRTKNNMDDLEVQVRLMLNFSTILLNETSIVERKTRRHLRILKILARNVENSFALAFPQRRMWCAVRDSGWFDSIVLRNFDDMRWKETFRINRSTFEDLCQRLRPHLERKTVVRKPFSVERRLAVTLARLGSSGELRMIADLYGMARSTVCIVLMQTTRVIVQHLSHNIAFPEGQEMEEVISSFLGNCGLPGVCGALDGTHIPIKAPLGNGKDYFNRKQFYSVVLQAVVNHKKKFTNVNFGWPGSVHDARVLANSELFSTCEGGYLNSYYSELPGTTHTIHPYIVADPAYPLKDWLMKPYSGVLSPRQAAFNKKLSSSRVYVEQSFGMLKGRWRCLLKVNESNLINVKYQVLASCILHNIAQDLQDEYLYQWEDQDTFLCNDPTIFPVLHSNNSQTKREQLMFWVENYGS